MNTVPRTVFPALKEALPDQRAIVITGMRRTGKTTSLRWLLEQVESTNKIYLDLERLDQRAVFQESDYDLVLDYLSNRSLDSSQPMTVALDEIQYAPNLQSVVKYHPIQSDDQKLKRIAAKHGLGESWLVGKYPTPGFSDFIWGGSIF